MGEEAVLLDSKALAETAAVFELAAAEMRGHVLDQERHAPIWSVAQPTLVQTVDAVAIDLHDRPDLGIDRLDCRQRRLGEPAWRDLPPADKIGQAKTVEGSVFGNFHCIVLCRARTGRTAWMGGGSIKQREEQFRDPNSRCRPRFCQVPSSRRSRPGPPCSRCPIPRP